VVNIGGSQTTQTAARIEALRGEVALPSLKTPKEELRVFGVLVRASLKSDSRSWEARAREVVEELARLAERV